jgi:hypothetical protein
MGKMRNLSNFGHGVIVDATHVVPASQKQLPSWDFYALQSLEFTENGVINRTHSVRGNSVGKNTLLMREGVLSTTR